MSTTASVSVQHQATKLDLSGGRGDLQFTDDILRNLSKDILPPQPFLISVPTDIPFRHPSRLEGVWRAGTPFNFDEEQLQYLSFHSHQEEDTLLQALGGWSDENGNILREEAQKQEFFGSGTNTPSVGPQKRKKITLGEYTKKGENNQNQDAHKLPGAKMAVTTVKVPHTQLKPAEADRITHAKKRSIEQVEATIPPQQNPAKASKSSAQPEKKARTSSPPRTLPKESSKPQEKHKKLPKLLSPNLPPTLIERKLPRLLSPTLPPGLEEIFAKKFPTETSNTPKKPPSDPPSQNNSRMSSAEKPKDKHPLNLDLQRDRSGSQNSTKSTASIPRSDPDRKGKPSPSIVAAKDLQKIRQQQQQQQEAQLSPRLKRIVVLKYGKRNSRTVQRLLKLAPKPKPTPDREHVRQEDKSKDKISVNQLAEVRKEKRSLPDAKEETQGPPTKRPKIPPSLDSANKPRTPVPQAFRSPLLQHSFSKTQLSTPKKPPKSIAMQRVESTEGDVRTPEGTTRSPRGANRNTTPLPVDQIRSATSSPSLTHQEDTKNLTSKPTHTPRPSSSSTQHPESQQLNSTPTRTREETHRAWRSQRDKYFPIGRSIKRSAQQLAVPPEPSSTSTSTPTSAKLSSVLFLEGLLAFMLNLAVNSKSQSVDWRSIIDYWAFVRNALQQHPDLRGLCLHLGVVCMGHIHHQDMERIEKTPLPPPPPSGNEALAIASAPTPGSDGQGQAARLEGDVGTSAGADYHRSKDRYNKMVNDMTANWRRLERTADEAEEALPWPVFSERFPRTWKRALSTTRAEVRRGEAEPEGMVYGIKEGRGFQVPIGDKTSGLEAVTWGMMALREWCGGKGVEWKSEIEKGIGEGKDHD